MSINLHRLQERLRERLLDHIRAGEFTGLQLAHAAGFQQAHISNFLNRKRGLSLEAMDAILEAAGIAITDLLPPAQSARFSISASALEPDSFVSVPIVREQLCVATEVPKQHSHETITLASALVQRWHPAMNILRPHWQRFLALRVKASDIAAMSPRLSLRTIAVIDRHHNMPPTRVTPHPDMFLIRTRGGFVIRYLETCSSGELLARPEVPGFALQVVDAAASIIGRICALQVRL